MQPTDLASELFIEEDQQAETSHASAALAEAEPSIKIESDSVALPISSSRKRRRAGSDDSQLDSHPSSASFTTAVEVADPSRANTTDTASLQLRVRQLEMQLAESKAKAEQSANVISAQHAIFENLHGQCICHICLEPSFRPCVLAPCGHVFCIHCLRSWFTKPLASEAAAPTGWSQSEIDRYNRSRTLKRKKICPSCRTELACPPVEVYLVRDMLEKVDEGLQLSKEADVDAQLAESSTAIVGQDNKARLKDEELPKGAKLWEDIFDQDGPRRIIFDEMDGVPRCGSCGSEIFDGACSNPSCAIEYDSHSDYDDLRRGGWDDMDDFDSDHYSQDDEGGRDGPPRPRRNGALAERLADFEARHGRSEGLDRGHRLELPDNSTGVTYIDSSDNEHIMRDHTDQRFHDDDEIDDDDEEMDDFIVRDDFDEEDDMLDRPRAYFDDSASEDDGGSYGMGSARYSEGEEDDFLPGPRRGGRGSAIEISDDDEDAGDRDSSVEYHGHRGGQRVRSRVADSDDDDDDDGEDDGYGDSDDAPTGSESDEDEREARLGSSNDSSARRRRARIVDDEDEDEVDEDEL